MTGLFRLPRRSPVTFTLIALTTKIPARQSRNRNSENLSQRRKDAKFLRKKFVRTWRSWRPLDETQDMLGEMNIRIRDFSLRKICARRANFAL
jgi:hypothetical protein